MCIKSQFAKFILRQIYPLYGIMWDSINKMDEEEGVSRINEISKLAAFVRWFLYKDCFQYIESDRPSLRALYDHVVNKVADKWKDLGV